jgi:hypothetical protein
MFNPSFCHQTQRAWASSPALYKGIVCVDLASAIKLGNATQAWHRIQHCLPSMERAAK